MKKFSLIPFNKTLKPVVLLIIGALVGAVIVNSNYNLPTGVASFLKFGPSPTPITSPSATPSPVESAESLARKECIHDLQTWIEENKDIKGTQDYLFGVVNTRYRFCLASKGLPPEDITPDTIPGSGSSRGSAPSIQVPNYNPPSNSGPSVYDKWKQEQAQDCARRQAAYSNCMAEYNSKMLEYNNCLQTNSNPNIFCYKPSSFNPCSKPLCSCVNPTKYPKLYNPMV